MQSKGDVQGLLHQRHRGEGGLRAQLQVLREPRQVLQSRRSDLQIFSMAEKKKLWMKKGSRYGIWAFLGFTKTALDTWFSCEGKTGSSKGDRIECEIVCSAQFLGTGNRGIHFSADSCSSRFLRRTRSSTSRHLAQLLGGLGHGGNRPR